jgi:ribosomal protein L11 methylase PrmA
VLSGILTTQEQTVLHAHLQRDLVLDFRLRLGEWSVLVLHKPHAKPRRRSRAA